MAGPGRPGPGKASPGRPGLARAGHFFAREGRHEKDAFLLNQEEAQKYLSAPYQVKNYSGHLTKLPYSR